MWLIKRWRLGSKSQAEVLPVAQPPMRRIEITVDRRWISRTPYGTPETGDPDQPSPEPPQLPEPPDL